MLNKLNLCYTQTIQLFCFSFYKKYFVLCVIKKCFLFMCMLYVLCSFSLLCYAYVYCVMLMLRLCLLCYAYVYCVMLMLCLCLLCYVYVVCLIRYHMYSTTCYIWTEHWELIVMCSLCCLLSSLYFLHS